MTTEDPLRELVRHAREGSPFYRELYRELRGSRWRLEQLPIASFDAVMAAVHDDYRALFAEERPAGMYYTTSGTTGRPKLTLFGREEWRTINRVLARAHAEAGVLRGGDIVGNLSEPGSASFMTVNRVVEELPEPCAEVPIGCDHPFEHIDAVLRRFGANVLTGMSPTFLGLAHHLLTAGTPNPAIERLLGGGELLYGSQRAMIARAFPNATFASFLYGTTEVGLVASSHLDDPLHVARVLPSLCRVEIVDPSTGDPVRKRGRSGRLLVTSWVRRAVPAIRMDTGDAAHWLDPPGSTPRPRFALEGRASPFAVEVEGGRISASDVRRLIVLLEGRWALIGVAVSLHDEEPRTRVRVALLDHGSEPPEARDAALEADLREAWWSLLPGWPLGPPAVKRAPYSTFAAGSRRKSKLLTDRRAAR